MKSKLEILEKVRKGEISPEDGAYQLKRLLSNIKFYTEDWVEESIKKADYVENDQSVIIVFCEDDRKREILEHFTGNQLIFVSAADRYTKSSQQEYGIASGREADYEHLFHEINKEQEDIAAIIHLWSLDADPAKKAWDSGLSVLNISKQLLKQPIKKELPFIYAYPKGEELDKVAHSAVYAIFCSLKEETTKLKGKCIALDQDNQRKLTWIIKQELRDTSAVHIEYQDKKRYAKSYKQLKLERRSEFIKGNGSCLIAGGAGSLGRSLTASIQNAGGNVIWCGRKTVKELPAGVVYYACDTTSREQVVRVSKELEQKGITLNGIIVCVGTTNDSILKEKDLNAAAAVLETKIQSVINLDGVFAGEPLDYFLMYSSIAAHIPSMGQSDYAFSNAYLDSYAAYRAKMQREGKRSGRTLSIAWPFFLNGGMQISQANLELMEKGKGLKPLDAAQQYELIQKMYGAEQNSIIVLRGDSEILLAKNGGKNTNQAQAAALKEDLAKTVIQRLKEIAADILREEVERIQDNGKFSSYGFDSITSVEFINAVNRNFDIKLLPSILFECTKLSSMAEYLLEHYMNEISSKIKAVPGLQPESVKVGLPVDIEERKQTKEKALAIIGMAGRFPKSRNIEEFWNHLKAQDDLVTEIPEERWNWQDYWDEEAAGSNQSNIIWGGFIEDVDKFDEKLFGISKREADYMNPQQRILLENVWEVFENAGYKPSDLRGKNIGVFVGTAGTEYSDVCLKNNVEISPYSSMGLSHSIDANRVSYFFDFHGPSEAIDTACSSSLVALNRAMKAIKDGECEEAIVAGVNVILTPSLYIAFEKAGMLSKTGKCSAFDKDADGFVRGEGVGTVYIKPLKKALEDRDCIYGIIKGTGVNHGGDASSLTAPNTLAQKELLEKVYQSAQVDFDTVSYLETHGTGTVLGDSVEVSALRSVYKDLHRDGTSDNGRCGLGSVKTNMGHLETAAGIAGIIKVLLSMQHELIPGNIHFQTQSPMVDLKGTPFYIQKENTPWIRQVNGSNEIVPRRAGISSFGFGGTNAHVILEEFCKPIREVSCNKYILLPVSAQTKQQLDQMVRNLYEYLAGHEEVSLHDAAYTLQNGREEFEVRYAVCAKERQELLGFMKLYLNGDNSRSYFGMISKSGKNEETDLAGDKERPFYEQICEKWVNGTRICWEPYYKNEDIRKVSLPGYEFQKNKHWVKLAEQSGSSRQIVRLRRKWEKTEDKTVRIPDNLVLLCEEEQRTGTLVKGMEGITAIVTPDCIDTISNETEHFLLDIRINENEETFFDTVMRCCQYFLCSGVPFHYIYAFDQNNSRARMAADALDSFFQSLWLENSIGESARFTYQIIGYEDAAMLNQALACRNEYRIYRNGMCLKQFIEQVPLESNVKGKAGLLHNTGGVYLVFGGAGGIGKVTVRYLLDHTNATVIIAGRSGNKKSIQPLSETYGKRLNYRKADIGDLDSVLELREQIINTYGSINGIVHSAGLNRDGSFHTKTLQEFREVLRAKVQGCIHLEKVFGQDKLDFMLLYTSVAAYYGSAGQTDYCLANRYMEAYADYRNERAKQGDAYGETIFIAWPIWKNIGMKMPEATQKRLFRQYGMIPMEESHGLKILTRVLKEGEGSFGYVYGGHISEPAQMAEADSIYEMGIDSVSLENQVFAYIKDLFVKLVGTENIDLDTTLEELCIDSIITTQFNEFVQKDIGKIKQTILFTCSDVREVVDFMVEHYGEALQKLFAAPSNQENVKEREGESGTETITKATAGQTKENRIPAAEPDDIAIIGFDGKFASADNVEELWEKLKCGADLLRNVPEGRWDNAKYYSKNPDGGTEGKYYCQAAGFLNQVNEFDPFFFHISPKEAELMDPQERMLLETAWNTVEKSGYNKEIIRSDYKNEVGVFVGVTTHTYNLIGSEELYKGNPEIAKSESWSIANRISYFMNWKGPSLAIDTACSSSLAALHYACRSLQEQESKMAFVGGVNLYLHPAKFIYMSQMKMLSETGICSPFSEKADGFVPGEGVGGMLLKTRKQAVLDGDRIYGIIKGSAVNHDGMTNGYTVPSVKEQANVIQKALRTSGVDPETISYVEAHGTGTRLGDPIEIAGLTEAWAAFTNRKQYCAIGSLKANVGHSEGCAGIASIFKVLLQFQHKQLVPSIHSENLNSRIDFEDSPFYVQHDYEEWKPKDGNGNRIQRRAAVSSFGAGGTNVHVILEEYQNESRQTASGQPEETKLFTLSARNEKQLEAYAEKFLAFLQAQKRKRDAVKGTGGTFDLTGLKVVDKLAELLEVSVCELSSTESFDTYGMDRILLEQYKQELRDIYGEHKNIREMTIEWTLEQLISSIEPDGMEAEQETEYDINFNDFIYTCQLREAFDERMIIKARNLQEIEQGLQCFLHKRKKETVMVHNIRKKPLEGVPEWINGKNVYVRSSEKNAEILDLPTYPFARQRYWTPVIEETKHSALNSILDENISTFTKQAYSKRVTKRDFYLKDHVVNGLCTLPGVFYLQMAEEASKRSLQEDNVVLKQITWLLPLTVGEGEALLTIELERYESGCRFRIFTVHGVHMQGNAVASYEAPADSVDIRQIQSRCQTSIPMETFYHDFEQGGIHYGKTLRGIQEVAYNEHEIIAKIKLPDGAYSLEEYPLHPAILDAALQATAALKKISGNKENLTLIPFGVKEMHVNHILQEQCYTYVNSMREENNMVVCDLILAGQDGMKLAEFKEFSFRVLETETKTQRNESTDAIHFYTPFWKASHAQESTEDIKHVLVFYDGEETDALFWDRYSAIRIRSGNQFVKCSAKEYRICPGEEQDYDRLLKELKKDGIDCFSVIHFWSDKCGFIREQQYSDCVLYGIKTVFCFCKAIVNARDERKVKFYLVNKTRMEAQNPFFTAISGFLKTVHLEHGRFEAKAIEVDEFDNAVWDKLACELCCEGTETEIRYRNGIREVKDIEKITMPSKPGKGFETEHCVYLITGALGGLSRLMIKKICHTENRAKFILTDLTGAGEQSEAVMKEILQSGREAVYIPADLTLKEDVERVVRKGKERFGQINCIIHTAGVICDETFRHKKFETLERVMAPKVYGTLNLDQATKEDRVEAFVLFSSLAAFGNAGQCDYAFANDFLVRFGEQRNLLKKNGQRKGKTIVLNWPLWSGGGMKTDKQTEELFQHFGMKTLDSDKGMEALNVSLGNEVSQVVVSQGIHKFIIKKLQSMFKLREDVKIQNPALAVNYDVKEQFIKKITEFMKTLLKIQEEIDLSADISDYGFDSISITELVNKINECYGLDILPTNVFEHNTIQKFIDSMYLKNEHKLSRFYEAVPESTSCAAPDELQSQIWLTSVMSCGKEPIAVIGMSCKMPGAENAEEFWNNLLEQKDVVTEIPADRWNWRSIYGDSKTESNMTLVKKAAFVRHIDEFDEELFGITNREAVFMDPVQRMVLEESYLAIEDAGIRHSDLRDSNTGVYIGLVSMEYYEMVTKNSGEIDPYLSTGNSRAVTANRVSYVYSLRGPSEVIDTACSSSIVAVERAVDDLRSGKCSMAVAGGANAILSPQVHVAYSRTGMLSPDGKCKTFDESADGYGRGEGCGIVILKPLSKAIEDHDPVHCVILGGGVNHTGRVNTLTTPNPAAQTEVIEQAVREAGIPFQSIGYIETHGTGTKLGDPIEIVGIRKAEEQLNPERLPHPCVLGAVKTNIGHLEGAAGIAGMVKAVKALEQNLIPANMNYKERNSFIQLEGTSFTLAEQKQPFPVIKDAFGITFPRRAGISSFGFGGVNAHIILESYENRYKETVKNNAEHVMVLSARTEEFLAIYIAAIRKWIGTQKEQMRQNAGMLQSMIYTLQAGREAQSNRIAIIFRSLEELERMLADHSNLSEEQGVYCGTIEHKDKSKQVLAVSMSREQMAKAFVTTAYLDWKSCYPEEPKRISLPARPLKRKRHWYQAGRQGKDLSEIINKRIKVPEEVFRAKVTFEQDMRELEEYCVILIVKEFTKRGYFTRGNEEYFVSDILNVFHVKKKYRRLLGELLEILQRHGYISLKGSSFITIDRVIEAAGQNMEELRTKFSQSHVGIQPHIHLLNHCVPHLMDIMEGKILATDILFPNSSMDLVKPIYGENPGANYYNMLVVRSVAAYIGEIREKDPDRMIRILEVGAGTGGTTKDIVAEIQKRYQNVTYTYTDMSNAFLNYGRMMYGKMHAFMGFRLLDVESDPIIQGFKPNKYDLIIGANVFHATSNLRSVMSYMKKLLKPSGWVILNEITKIQAFLTLTFGLTEGWWLYEDEEIRLKGGPLLSLENWDILFCALGFDKAAGVDTILSGRAVPQEVIIAKNSGEEVGVMDNLEKQKIHTEKKAKPVYTSALDTEYLEQYVRIKITEAISKTLMVEPDTIDMTAPYSEYGVDSILGAECVNAINNILHVTVDTTELFNRTDIIQLAKFISQRYQEDFDQMEEVRAFVTEQNLSALLDQYQNDELDLDEILNKLEIKYGEE